MVPWFVTKCTVFKNGSRMEMFGRGEIVEPVCVVGNQGERLLIARNLRKGYIMQTRTLWRVLFIVIIGITLSGCACNQNKARDEAMAQVQTPPPPVVQQAPAPRPPVQPTPPPKKDRN